MPEISLPDIKLPDVRFRDGKLRDMKLPDIDLRDRLPDVDLSKISLPAALRDMSMPDMSMPDIHMPEMHMPDINLRDMKAPKVDLSDLDLKSLDPRRIDLSGVDAKRLRAMVPFARPAPKPASPLPWVVVAAVGGLFAGWWLATSSVTGPKVREFAERVKARIADWRGARADWDDVEEHAEGFWSTEDGWKQEGSRGATRGPSPESDVTTLDTPAWDEGSAASAMGGAETGDGAGAGYSASQEGVGGTGYEPGAGAAATDMGNREG